MSVIFMPWLPSRSADAADDSNSLCREKASNYRPRLPFGTASGRLAADRNMPLLRHNARVPVARTDRCSSKIRRRVRWRGGQICCKQAEELGRAFAGLSWPERRDAQAAAARSRRSPWQPADRDHPSGPLSRRGARLQRRRRAWTIDVQTIAGLAAGAAAARRRPRRFRPGHHRRRSSTPAIRASTRASSIPAVNHYNSQSPRSRTGRSKDVEGSQGQAGRRVQLVERQRALSEGAC